MSLVSSYRLLVLAVVVAWTTVFRPFGLRRPLSIRLIFATVGGLVYRCRGVMVIILLGRIAAVRDRSILLDIILICGVDGVSVAVRLGHCLR